MMFLLNLFKNLVMKMLIKEIGNPLDFLTTSLPPPPSLLKGIRQLLWFYNPGGWFCQISGVQVYRGCGSLHIFRWHQYQVTLVTEHPRLSTLGPLALQSFYI
jgi:hypothetical protein